MMFLREKFGVVRGGAYVVMLALSAVGLAAAQEAEVVLEKEGDVVVYHDARMYSAFPSVVELPDGELLCAFRRAPSRRYLYGAGGDSHTDANSYLVSVRSTDGGESWTSVPELIHAHPFGGSQDPCLLGLKDGSLLCTSYGWAPMGEAELKGRPDVLQNPGFGFLGGFLLKSADNGRSWSEPIYPPELPGNDSVSAQGGPLPAYNRGALLQLEDGTILWATARHDGASPRRTSVHLIRSMDGGYSWDYGTTVAADGRRSFNETSLIELKNGDIIALLRTADKDMGTAMARSTDGGKTFGPVEDVGWSGLPHHAIQLEGGGVLIVYGYRAAPFGIRARVVADDFSDIMTAPEFIVRDDGGNGDVGYPWAVEVDEDRVLVVYYINVDNGPRHIAGTWLRINRSHERGGRSRRFRGSGP